MRAACVRHLRDLERQSDKGFPYRFDPTKAERFFRYCELVLKLDGGSEDPKPFALLGWQKFVGGCLFGWVRKETGFRRFVTAFVETGKGSGKSPFAAGIGLYMMQADDPIERRAEVYAAAVDKEQASILFRDAVSMTKLSPRLDQAVTRSGGEGREFNIAYHATGSFFRPISSESQGRGKSGYRPHCVLLDEIHEHPTNAMVEFMRAGTKGRKQALIFMITNSGADRTSVCYEYHEYGGKVAAGEIEDDTFFAYICGLDEGDDPFEDRACWPKANPSLGVTFDESYLEAQVASAKGMPSKESIVRRLNFCQWVDAANPWIDGDLWRSCEVEDWTPPPSDRPHFFGLDLSSSRDLTAAAQVWPDGEGGYDAELHFWTPEETLPERERADRVPYSTWVERGFLNTTPGRTIDFEHVGMFLGQFDPVGVAFDPYRIGEFQKALDRVGVDSWIWDPKKSPTGRGLKLVRHGQGYGGGAVDVDDAGNEVAKAVLWMPASIAALRKLIMTGKLRVKRNPVLTWNSASAVVESDAAGNEKWEKRKSTGRIDGIVALSMAAGLASATPAREPTFEVFFLG